MGGKFMYIGTGYFDAQKGGIISKEEHQKMKAEKPKFSAIKKLSKCFVCENEFYSCFFICVFFLFELDFVYYHIYF